MPVAGRSVYQEAQSRERWGSRLPRREGLPMPVAGRSLRAPPSARSVLTRFAGHRSAAGGLVVAALVSKRRLPGTGSPSLAVSL
jgi:hypothetical protein